MNRGKSGNGTQQMRKKIPLSVPQERPGTNKRRRSPLNTYDSGINFVVDISSSGTNLNKKIQDEITKLEDVERKIRQHKTKAKAICLSAKAPSSKSSNERKLKHLLEDMEIADSGLAKQKKQTCCFQKFRETEKDNTAMNRYERNRKCGRNDIKMESFTNLKDRRSCNKDRKKDVMKKSTSLRKSMKKPTSAPNAKSESLVRDMKFAESLNFGKKVDLHLSISDTKKINFSPDKRSRKNFTDISKCMVEKRPRSSLSSHMYDSTSFVNVNYDSDQQHDRNEENKPERGIFSLKENDSFQREVRDRFDRRERTIISSRKPERKRFYSFLKRGNFTISHHSDDKTDDERHSEHVILSENNSELIQVRTEKTESPSFQEISKRNDIKEEINMNSVDGLSKGEDDKNTIFPTDLIERSIVAVENVLRTINSITKDFSARNEMKDILQNNRPKMIQASFNVKLNSQQGELPNRTKIEKEILILKSPIQSFFASEEIINFQNTNITCHPQRIQNSQKNSDPLSSALYSLNVNKRAEELTTYVNSEGSIPQTQSFSSSCISITIQKSHKDQSSIKNDFFKDKHLSKTSCPMDHQNNRFPWPSTESVTTHENIVSSFPKSTYQSTCEIEDQYIFPEYYFQKCLTLLRKKFRDFEKIRCKNPIGKHVLKGDSQHYNVLDDMMIKLEENSKEESTVYYKKNTNEKYQVCYKNENFKNQSETSVESWNKTDG